MDGLTVLTQGFSDWLVARTGPAASSPTRQGVKLDAFGTSMRDTKPVAANLAEVEAGGAVTHTDPTQRITDLAGTGLVERDGVGGCTLTALGRAVLEEWRRLGVADADTGNELVRQTVLVDRGIALHPNGYGPAWTFWNELVQVHAPEDWFANPQALYMVSYLNYEDNQGYNPWTVIRAVGGSLLATTNAQWDAWAAATTTPSGWSRTCGEKLLAAVRQAATRYVGRVNFCMALEARRRAVTGLDVAASIKTWSVPHA